MGFEYFEFLLHFRSAKKKHYGSSYFLPSSLLFHGYDDVVEPLLSFSVIKSILFLSQPSFLIIVTLHGKNNLVVQVFSLNTKKSLSEVAVCSHQFNERNV